MFFSVLVQENGGFKKPELQRVEFGFFLGGLGVNLASPGPEYSKAFLIGRFPLRPSDRGGSM